MPLYICFLHFSMEIQDLSYKKRLQYLGKRTPLCFCRKVIFPLHFNANRKNQRARKKFHRNKYIKYSCVKSERAGQGVK